jgi:hypothetical protein
MLPIPLVPSLPPTISPSLPPPPPHTAVSLGGSFYSMFTHPLLYETLSFMRTFWKVQKFQIWLLAEMGLASRS